MRDILVNPVTGDRLEFLQTTAQTNGKKIEFLLTLASGSSWAKWPKHFHPFQEETFKVVKGELHLTKGNDRFILTNDDAKLSVEPFELHAFWNQSHDDVLLHAEIFNPGQIEKGLRYNYELAQQGKVNKRNIPYNPFLAFILMSYVDSYLPYLPWKLQRFLFKLGAKLSFLLGFK